MQRTHRVHRPLRAVAATLSATLALLGAVLLLTMVAQAGRVLPGTVVAGVDVGGRHPASAERVLREALAREERRPVLVSHPGGRSVVRPSDAGLRFDVPATVEAAFARGRTGPTWPLERLRAPLQDVALAPRSEVDEAALSAWFTALADDVDRSPDPGDLRIAPAGREVAVVTPLGGVRIDRAASIAGLRAALADPAVTSVTLAAEVTPPPVTRAALDVLAGRLERALAGAIVLHHEGRTLRVEPETLSRLVTLEPGGDASGDAVADADPRLRVDVERLTEVLGPRASATFDRSPARARIATPDVAPDRLTDRGSTRFAPVAADVAVVPATTRTVFVARRTARQLEAMIAAGERVAEADLLIIEPDVTAATFAAGVPTHLLGTFTTFHPPGTARATNIRRLAALLDGTLVAPGAVLSVNDTSGPRRCEDGFVPAGTIIRGELVDTCAGGTSQFGTTLFNAGFFAGLPLEQWQPHSFFIGRYPAGREATLTYPELDVRLRNDSDAWMVLRTATTPDSVTASLYGVPRWQEVIATHEPWRDPTPFPEVVRTAPDLAPGTSRVVQSGGEGFTVDVRRTRVPFAGAEATVERWRTVYVPQVRIVEVGEQPPVSPDAGPADAAPPAAGAGANAG